MQQIERESISVQEEIENSSLSFLSNDEVLRDAKNLSEKWNTLERDDKKRIIDVVLTSIIVGEEDIEIKLSHLPTLQSSSSSDGGSSNFSPPTNSSYLASPYRSTNTINQKNAHSFESVQLSNANMSLWVL